MEQVDKLFQDAIADGRIAGAVLFAKDLTGKIDVSRTYGVRSIREEAPEKRPPMTVDTPMYFASFTKLITSIVALQCVERGIVNLDETIDRLLPEVAAFKVLTGFDEEGKPIERERKSPMLLRHLLSHSSGIEYAVTNDLIIRYRQYQGVEIDQGYDTLEKNFGYPLMFEPGEGWAYGPSIDWVGRLLERATGTRMEELVRQNIAAPLGIDADDMTFELQKHPGTQARRADMPARDPATGKLHHQDEKQWHVDMRDAHGGQGLFSTPAAYSKVLWSVLSDDGKLLRPETRALLFEPTLTPRAVKGAAEYCEKVREYWPAAPVPIETRKSHSVGGLITLEDCDGDRWRRKGNLSWGGMPNLIWNIDREVGLCSLYAFHMRPWGDAICNDLGRKFEEALYAILKE